VVANNIVYSKEPLGLFFSSNKSKRWRSL